MNIKAMSLVAGAAGLLSLTTTVAQGGLIAGWYEWTSNGEGENASVPADETAAGFTGSLLGGDGGRTGFHSTDGTYGPTEVTNQADPNVNDGGFTIRTQTGDQLVFATVNNNSGAPFALEEYVFDYFAGQGNSFTDTDTLTLSYGGGDLGVVLGTVIGTLSEVNDAPTRDRIFDYLDHSFSLTGLADNTLADGESATFILTASTTGHVPSGTTEGSPSGGTPVGLDNIAVLGKEVPEPASVALLGLGGLLILISQRRIRG